MSLTVPLAGDSLQEGHAEASDKTEQDGIEATCSAKNSAESLLVWEDHGQGASEDPGRQKGRVKGVGKGKGIGKADGKGHNKGRAPFRTPRQSFKHRRHVCKHSLKRQIWEMGDVVVRSALKLKPTISAVKPLLQTIHVKPWFAVLLKSESSCARAHSASCPLDRCTTQRAQLIDSRWS